MIKIIKSITDSFKLLYYLLNPKTIFVCCFSSALGDTLMITGFPRKLKQKFPNKKVVVEVHKRSPHFRELFSENPYVDFVTEKHFCSTKRHFKPDYYVDTNTTNSLYAQLAKKVNLEGYVYPEVYLNEKELEEINKKYPYEYVVVCPEGKKSHVSNRKEWGVDNFQELVNCFPKTKFLQIGSKTDKLLENVVDLRDSLSAKELALIMKNSLLFVGLEGGLMHMAKAVSNKSIIIYGGFLHPNVSGYAENINIYSKVVCSPCFNSRIPSKKCETMKCMRKITVKMVAEKFKLMVAENGNN